MDSTRLVDAAEQGLGRTDRMEDAHSGHLHPRTRVSSLHLGDLPTPPLSHLSLPRKVSLSSPVSPDISQLEEALSRQVQFTAAHERTIVDLRAQLASLVLIGATSESSAGPQVSTSDVSARVEERRQSVGAGAAEGRYAEVPDASQETDIGKGKTAYSREHFSGVEERIVALEMELLAQRGHRTRVERELETYRARTDVLEADNRDLSRALVALGAQFAAMTSSAGLRVDTAPVCTPQYDVVGFGAGAGTNLCPPSPPPFPPYTHVVHTYTPSLPDEVPLTPGDVVHLAHVHADGWCDGVNMTLGAAGVFPVACLASVMDDAVRSNEVALGRRSSSLKGHNKAGKVPPPRGSSAGMVTPPNSAGTEGTGSLGGDPEG